jgi:hypothetical protein
MGARFFCRATLRVLDGQSQAGDMMITLSKFEYTLGLALAARVHHPLPEAAKSAHELISVVEDLVWALLQMVSFDGTRLVHCFQTEPFPVPRGWRNPCPAETLSRLDVALRRAILAVVACLLWPSSFTELARTVPRLASPSRYCELLDLLGKARSDFLLSRAHRWPTAFRKQMGLIGSVLKLR